MTFYYDLQCRFCRRSALVLRALTRGLEIEPAEGLAAALYLSGARRYDGHRAIGRVLQERGRGPIRLAGDLLLAPVLDAAWSRMYEWVARHRYRFGCSGS